MIKDVVVKRKSYKNKAGEDKIDYHFYLVLENDKKVRISPYRCDIKGKEFDTFRDLILIAKNIDNKDEE